MEEMIFEHPNNINTRFVFLFLKQQQQQRCFKFCQMIIDYYLNTTYKLLK